MDTDNKIKAFIKSEVKAWGCSGHIPIQKKYVGHQAEVVILEKEIKDEEATL